MASVVRNQWRMDLFAHLSFELYFVRVGGVSHQAGKICILEFDQRANALNIN